MFRFFQNRLKPTILIDCRHAGKDKKAQSAPRTREKRPRSEDFL
jgi:hypothetical protein